jgi:hypothetical protein
MTTQKVVEAAERYVSRQPVHTRVSGKPLYEHKQMIRAFCAGEIAIIDHGDSSPPTELAPFQERVQPWMMACFGEMIAGDREERNHRFLEEALELVQSTGCTIGEAHQLVDYVYGRAVGEPHQEVGGVMVTLAALCLANGLDMHQAAETELARIWTKVEQIRAKQAAKPKHSPLPEAVTPSPSSHVVGADDVPEELLKWTFAVQHNPNCPSPYLVRLPGKSGIIDMKPYGDGVGFVRHQTGDILGFGKTFAEAARAALSTATPEKQP